MAQHAQYIDRIQKCRDCSGIQYNNCIAQHCWRSGIFIACNIAHCTVWNTNGQNMISPLWTFNHISSCTPLSIFSSVWGKLYTTLKLFIFSFLILKTTPTTQDLLFLEKWHFLIGNFQLSKPKPSPYHHSACFFLKQYKKLPPFIQHPLISQRFTGALLKMMAIHTRRF